MTTHTTKKASTLAALTKPIEPPDVFSVLSLTPKKRIQDAMKGTAK